MTMPGASADSSDEEKQAVLLAFQKLDRAKMGAISFEDAQEIMCPPAGGGLDKAEFLQLVADSGAGLVRYASLLEWIWYGRSDSNVKATSSGALESTEVFTLKARIAELEGLQRANDSRIAELEKGEGSQKMRFGATLSQGRKSSQSEPQMKKLVAEAQYNAAFEELGGIEATKKCRLESMQIASLITRRTGLDPWEQDPVYRGLETSVLMRDAERACNKFEEVCNELKKVMCEDGLSCKVLMAACKGIVRAQSKIAVKYSGNVCQLSDITRATLKITAAGKDTLSNTYRAMLKFASSPPEGVQFLHFDDRFMSPMKGGYRDFLFLVCIQGILCELQINFDIMLQVKDCEGHEEYEVVRLNDDLMLAAAQKNDSSAVKLFLRKGANPNYMTATRFTALSYAAMHGNELMALALVEAQADLFQVDCTGSLAVTRALTMQKFEAAEVLLSAMAKQCSDTSCSMELRRVTRRDIIKTYFALRVTLKDQIGSKTNKLMTLFQQVFERVSGGVDVALVTAAEAGLAAVCKSLLQAKAQPNAWISRSDIGENRKPMDFAIEGGSVSVVKLLRDHGGKTTFWNAKTSTLAAKRRQEFDEIALRHDLAEKVDALIEASQMHSWKVDLDELLVSAAGAKAIRIVKVVLHRGTSANTLQPEQVAELALCGVQKNDTELLALLMARNAEFSLCQAAMCEAAEAGKIDMVKLLVEANGPLEGVPSEDRKEFPIHLAARAGHTEMVTTLIRLKSSMDQVCESGHCSGITAGHLAAEFGHIGVLQVLHKNNFDFNGAKTMCFKENFNGANHQFDLLHAAVIANQPESVRVLLSLRCNPNCREAYGGTPLLHAAVGSRLDVLKVLAFGGADLNLAYEETDDKDRQWRVGMTAVHTAAARDCLDILKLLVDLKADIHIQAADGKTALDVAISNGARSILTQAGAQTGSSTDQPTSLRPQTSPHPSAPARSNTNPA